MAATRDCDDGIVIGNEMAARFRAVVVVDVVIDARGVRGAKQEACWKGGGGRGSILMEGILGKETNALMILE